MVPLPLTQITPFHPRVLSRQRSLPLLPNFHQNWPIGVHINHNGHILHRFMPVLAEAAYRLNARPDVVGQQFAYNSDEVEEKGGMPSLSTRDLEEAYAIILHIVQASHSDHDVSVTIRNFLQTSFEEDWRRTSYGHQHSRDQTLRCFRALAEISRQTNSFRMGYILCDFFLSNGAALMEYEDSERILLWGYAIHRARMLPDERRLCQEAIAEYAPDILDSFSRYGSPHAPYLRRELARFANDFGIGGTYTRGRHWDRASRRRFFSPSRSPNRLSRHVRRLNASPRDLVRPHSAPGNRQIERQADRVIEAAEEMQEEAQILRDLAIRR